MCRNLHITIHDGSALPRAAAGAVPVGRRGSDPTTAENVMPDPENPSEADLVMPDPENPSEADLVMPDPENPSGGAYGYGYGGGYATAGGSGLAGGCAPVAVYAASCPETPCCCAGAAAEKAAPERPGVAPRDYSGFVIVRLDPGVESAISENLWDLAARVPIPGLAKVLALGTIEEARLAPPADLPCHGSIHEPEGILVSRPLIDRLGRPSETKEIILPRPPMSREETVAAIRDLEDAAGATPFPPLHSLNAYWRLDLRNHPELLEEVVAQLRALPRVDLAYRELRAVEPANGVAWGEGLGEDQGYLGAAPAGIDAVWAWGQLAAGGDKVRVCDLEQGWNLHQDFQQADVTFQPLYGANRASEEAGAGEHGTAVVGQLTAVEQNVSNQQACFGVQGAAAGAGKFLLASHYLSKDLKEGSDPHPFAGTNGHVAAAIANALVPAKPEVDRLLMPGDVLLLELQRGRLPTEIDAADLDAIRLASALGVVVVEAAGNGGFDLDAYVDPDTANTLRRGAAHFRDSGAILVGAARAALPHDRAPFSNFGSRLDCFAWGETVTTCGYGNLAGTQVADFYTNTFSGTSSASPIIAGAAVLVQALYHQRTDHLLDPRAMRVVLSDATTGTCQGPNVAGFIGVMPDLRAVVRDRLGLVPDLYLRRTIGDDGAQPYAGTEISSSPDLFSSGAANPAAAFGEASPHVNDPAPGEAITPGHKHHLYVRLRNRGGGTGEVRVNLFASPAATLITPERWIPIASKLATGVPKGDRLTVCKLGHRPVPPQTAPPSTVPYSLLAILRPADAPSLQPPFHDRTHGLPPGPPYFDWAAYRAFLRGPGVAWRNVHRVAAGTDLKLPFYLAGTPDQARYFDFEVIQRLPEKVKVTLDVPKALAAKLRQRQPWIANGSGSLVLPPRRRTTLSRVLLAAGVLIDATLHVEVGDPSSTVKSGHSLAIRQLWRGEEVGRITWWFVEPPAVGGPLHPGDPTQRTE
jgi:serine protease